MYHHVIEINTDEILTNVKETKNKNATPFIPNKAPTESLLNCMHPSILFLKTLRIWRNLETQNNCHQDWQYLYQNSNNLNTGPESSEIL